MRSQGSVLTWPTSIHLYQQPEDDRPGGLVLLQVEQQLAEGTHFWVAPELADPLDSVEIGEAQDVEEFGASRRREGLETSPESRLNLLEGHGASVTG
jgi:hypothetical protein